MQSFIFEKISKPQHTRLEQTLKIIFLRDKYSFVLKALSAVILLMLFISLKSQCFSVQRNNEIMQNFLKKKFILVNLAKTRDVFTTRPNILVCCKSGCQQLTLFAKNFLICLWIWNNFRNYKERSLHLCNYLILKKNFTHQRTLDILTVFYWKFRVAVSGNG